MIAATWYFIVYASYAAVPSHIGPMRSDQCSAIHTAVPTLGTCRQAAAMRLCPVEGRPDIVMPCPVFDPLPSVTLKEKPNAN